MKDSSSKYPYLRVFSTYEGHSWASGHANFADGNNQESSSESINAWAALILYGQATGNEELTDLGVYLYTTEVNSVNNYWFDIDGDILDSNYTASTTSANKHNVASIVWGGKYDYAAWWTAEPLQIQGINLLPITSASYYLGKSTDFVKANFESAQANEKHLREMINYLHQQTDGMNYGVLIWHWLIQTKLRSILVQHVHQRQEIQKLMLTTLLSHWRKLEVLN